MNIGLTGGIASGKSTAAQILVKKGAHLVDADQIAREIVEPGQAALSEIAQHFGQDILKEDGSLNRERLGQVIFQDASQKKVLESIMHPRIRTVMMKRMELLEKQHANDLVVVDVPLLFESGLAGMFEEVWLVYVPESIQLTRLMLRNDLTEQEARARIQSQMPIDQKKDLADVVIDNSGSMDATIAQIEQHWRRKGLA